MAIDKKDFINFETEFNQGQQDFQRLHILLLNLDRICTSVIQRERTSMYPFYSLLKTLKININSFLKPTERTMIEDMFVPADTAFSDDKIDEDEVKAMAKQLPMIYQELLHLRQQHKIGIPFKVHRTAQQKLREALGKK